jgi:uncharacterized protein
MKSLPASTVAPPPSSPSPPGLRFACALSVIALGILQPAPGFGQGPAAAPLPRTLTVVGNGQLTAAPDLAVVALAVETEAPAADQAVADNARRTQQVIAALRPLLGGDDRLTTAGYSLQPRYHQPPRPDRQTTTPEIAGYVARNQVRVELRALDRVGRVIDVAAAAGANRVDHLQFLLERREPALRTALADAAREARAQAESVAAALGVTLGQVLEATTGAPGHLPQPRAMRAEALVTGVPTPVEPGEVTVQATLQVTYAIE